MEMSRHDCQLHPSFKTKPVYELRCVSCDKLVCVRGMRAILLANRSVELFSTDMPLTNAVRLFGPTYQTNNCHCQIQDVVCGVCGTSVGYHVTVPCQGCLNSCNNGHFWMYHSSSVDSSERLDESGSYVLYWARIPSCSEDNSLSSPPKWLECNR